jgi:hypothetical protein
MQGGIKLRCAEPVCQMTGFRRLSPFTQDGFIGQPEIRPTGNPTTARRAGAEPLADLADLADRCDHQVMRASFLAVIVCVLVGTPSIALSGMESPATPGVDQIKVTAVSADPIAPCGILATAVEVSGTIDGAQATYYIPFMWIGQPKPRAGQTCDLSWRWHDAFRWIIAGGSVQGARLVSSYACQGEEAVKVE